MLQSKVSKSAKHKYFMRKSNFPFAHNGSNFIPLIVIHPNVRDHIDTDLDLLRTLAYTIDNLPISYSKALKWLNLQGMADEFASMLKIQLDLRTEAQHLDKFNENFAHDPDVIFPQVCEPYLKLHDILM